eukprot:6687186-Prymnesium_polylepis.1
MSMLSINQADIAMPLPKRKVSELSDSDETPSDDSDATSDGGGDGGGSGAWVPPDSPEHREAEDPHDPQRRSGGAPTQSSPSPPQP